MPKSKYKVAVEEMMEQHQELFAEFEKVHNAYVEDPRANQEEFNEVGKQVLRVMQDSERRLCSKTEGGGYGRYSANLAEKFRAAVQEKFPKIHRVGVTMK